MGGQDRQVVYETKILGTCPKNMATRFPTCMNQITLAGL
jgi:hypothetical protein